MFSKTKFLTNFFKNTKKSKISKVSFIQKPGDSINKSVTLLPGEGIGRDLCSIITPTNPQNPSSK